MIIGQRVTNPGEMRTQVTLKMRDLTVNDGGFQTLIDGASVTVWGKWTNVHGSEVWEAATLSARKPATVLDPLS